MVSSGSLPEMCLEFAEGLLDRVEVQGIFGRITQLGAGCFKFTSRTAATLWNRRAIHHRNVAAPELLEQDIL